MTSSERAPARRGPRRRASLSSAAAALAAALVLGSAACGGNDDGRRAGAGTGSGGRARPTAARRGPVTTGFEGRDLPADPSAHGVVTTAAAARSGRRGLEVRARGGDAFLRWDADDLGEGRSWSFRAWVRVVDWTDAESVDLFTVRNREGANNFDLFVGAPYRRFQWDLYREDSGETAGPLAPGEWHLVEAKGSFGTATSTAEVRIDGVDQPPIASPGQVPSVAREFVLGSFGTDKTNTTQFDDVAIAVSDAPLPFLGAPALRHPAAAPVATPGVQP
jgi:hypothetical protein